MWSVFYKVVCGIIMKKSINLHLYNRVAKDRLFAFRQCHNGHNLKSVLFKFSFLQQQFSKDNALIYHIIDLTYNFRELLVDV